MEKSNLALRPIPLSDLAWDWQQVYTQRIEECGEPLVSLSFAPERILVSSQYYLQQIPGALPEIFVRQTVQEKLMAAAELLPDGYRLVALDCWRPVSVQQALFHSLEAELEKQYPGESREQLRKRTSVFVALPSFAPDRPSPHNTGGSVDLTIADKRGCLLDMGTEFDNCTKRAGTDYFERKLLTGEPLSQGEHEACSNRRLLYQVMTAVGFVNYSDEWWHFDYGNQNWAWKSGGATAIYGRSKPDFTWNKGVE